MQPLVWRAYWLTITLLLPIVLTGSCDLIDNNKDDNG